MQNEIYDEKNGLTYMLCGDYYLPELALTDIEPTYGKYGMLRKSYLQEHRKAKYQILLLQGKLVEHLNQIDAEARDREEQLVKQMMEKQGITEKLKRQTLLLQFRDAMQSVAAALQAGYSMENAWRESEKEMTELYGQDGIFVGELHQINQAVGMNQPIEKLLYEFALRSDCEDIQNFSDVFLFAKRSGGDFHKIIATTIEHISDKIEVEREVQTVISAKKMEQKIMNVIPVFIILYLNLTSGEFLAPLYGNIFGISVMTGALGAYLAAIKISAKMTAIKV